MAIIRLLAILTATISFTGCISVKTDPLEAHEETGLLQSSVAVAHYDEQPDFTAQTAANVQFGLLGLASAIESGNNMIDENNIQDPAITIASRLAEEIQSNYHVTLADQPVVISPDTKPRDFSTHFSQVDYVIDVKTLGWGSIYYPSDWDNYRVIYQAHARLVETNSGDVVAEVLCAFLPEYEDTELAPSYEDLEAGEALQTELNRSVDLCVEHIRASTNIGNPSTDVASDVETTDSDV